MPTEIEWTATRHADGTITKGETWNPTTGCTEISAGCKFCYAKVMHTRLRGMHQKKYAQPWHELRTHEDELKRPFRWKRPRTVFVNSMSDLMHDRLPVHFVRNVFTVMNQCPAHTFQVLTKRGEVLLALDQGGHLNWTPNIWMGVSVEDNRVRYRIDQIRQTGAHIKFLSLEPLIGPLPDLNLEGIDWVIVGGESGRNPRPMAPEWVEDIRQQCERAGVAFFFKQHGGTDKKASGRLLNGRTYDEMPKRLTA